MRRQTECGKIFAKNISNEGLLPKMCKEHLKLSKKRTWLKNRPRNLTDTFPKNISIGKDFPYYVSKKMQK